MVRLPDGGTSLDFTGKKPAEGLIYVRISNVWKKARKARRLERNLNISISEDIYDALEAELQKNAGEH